MDNSNLNWKEEAKELAIKLHLLLIIDDKNWHELKNDSDRRAAEQLSAAMVQLVSGGESSNIEDLIQQSLLWVKREIKAPKCTR
tara:strand:+ start:1645 stop:1896 length:252 start_codon:yes stop_codon:yes gene_type:complete